MRRLVYLLAALSGLGLPAPGPARGAELPPFAWKDGDRVVLIGDALIERDQEYGLLETVLTLVSPDKTISFRNLGWSGDTVFGTARARFGTEEDGFKHLKEHVLALKPTVLIVGYGMTDSFAGAAGLPRFTSGLNHLLDVVGETHARVVLLSPIAHEDLGRPLPDPTRHNEALLLYRDAIRDVAATRGAWFVDLFERFATLLASADGAPGSHPKTVDGIHPNKAGYLWLGTFLRSALCPHPPEGTSAKIAATAQGLRVERTRGFLNLSEGASLGNYSFPNSFGDPGALGEALLPDGRYRLTIDGRDAAEADAGAWRKGPVVCSFDPNVAQAEQLRQAIVEKNRLYFYRWRPQNETYLFGFRKHEQGNNAREIPLFDPLVEEKEKEIARLKVPVKHIYELIRVGEGTK